MKIFALYDTGIESHAQPFFQPNAHAALRVVKANMTQDSMLAQHPEDFELYELGDFNEQTGELTSKRERVARLKDIADSQRQS